MTVLVGWTGTTLGEGNNSGFSGADVIKIYRGDGASAVASGTATEATFVLDGQYNPNGSIFRIMLYKDSDRSLVAYSDWIDDSTVTVNVEQTTPVTTLQDVVSGTPYMITFERDPAGSGNPNIRLSDQTTSSIRGSIEEGGTTSGYTQDTGVVPDPLPPTDNATGGNQNGAYIYFSETAAPITVDDINTDNAGYPGEQVRVNVSGDIGATQGSGSVTMFDASRTHSVSLTVDAWNQGDGSSTGYVDVTIPTTGLNGASDHEVDLVTDGGTTATFTGFTLESAPGNAFVDIVDPDLTSSSIFYQMTGTPVNGDQIEHDDAANTTMNPDGTFTQGDPVNFQARLWDESDGTWGTWTTINVSEVYSTGMRFGSPVHPSGGLRYGEADYESIIEITTVEDQNTVADQVTPNLDTTLTFSSDVTVVSVELRNNVETFTATLPIQSSTSNSVTVSGARGELKFGESNNIIAATLDTGTVVEYNSVTLAAPSGTLYVNGSNPETSLSHSIFTSAVTPPSADYQIIYRDPNNVNPTVNPDGTVTDLALEGDIFVSVWDGTNGTTTSEITYSATFVPPQGTVTITDTSVTGADVTVTASYSDNDADSYEIRFNGGAPQAFTYPSDTFTLSNGSYDAEVRAVNSGGTSAWSSISSFTISATPVGTVTYDSIVTDTSTADVTISYSDTDQDGFEYSVDGGAYVDVGNVTNFTITGLNDNTTFNLDVRAYNQYGSGNVASTTFTTDEIVPQGTVTFDSVSENITSADVTISYSNTDQDGFEYSLDGGAYVDVGNVTSFSITGLTDDTTYSLDVRAYNSGGSGTVASTTFTTVISVPQGTVTISDITPSTSDADVTISYSDTDQAGFEYRIDGGAWVDVGNVTNFTVPSLADDTTFNIDIRAYNISGESSIASDTFTTIEIAPQGTVSITSTTENITSVDFGIDYSNTDQDGFEYRLDGGAWVDVGNVSSFSITGLSSDTTYAVDIRAYNSGGASGFVSRSVTTLVQLPQGTVTIDSVTESETSANVSISYNDTDQTGFEYRIDGGSWIDVGNNTSFTISGLNDDTTFSLDVRAYNSTGGGSIASTTFTTPIQNPQGTITYNSVTENVTSVDVTFSYSNTDQDGFEYRIDGGAWTDIGNVNTFTASGLTASTSYTIEIRAYNGGGESSIASFNFTTLEEAPQGTVTFSSITVGTSSADITISYSDTDQDGFEYRIDGGSWTSVGDITAFTVSGLTDNTTYNIDVRAFNSTGDSAIASDTFTTNELTLAGTVTIDGVVENETTADITISYSDTDQTGFEYSLDGGAWIDIGNNTSFTISGLNDDTTYSLNVRAYGTNGTSDSASTIFTTAVSAPQGTVSISTITENINSANVTISYSSDDQAGFEYRLDGGMWVDVGNNTTFTVNSLNADTTYTFEVRAYNISGETSAASSTFTTLIDKPQGTVSFDSITENINSVDFAISYNNTDQSGFEYRLDGGAWIALGNVNTFSITGLNSLTSYQVEIRAYNSSGGGSVTTTTVITLVDVPQGTVTYNSITERITSADVSIAYSASDQDGFEYRIDGGAWKDVGNVTSFIVTGLTDDTTYTIETRAYNTTGESSIASDTFTTVISKPEGSISLNSVTKNVDSIDFDFSYNDTDQDGFEYKVNDNVWVDIGDVTTFSLTGLNSNTTYDVSIRAYNVSGYSTIFSTSATTKRAAPEGTVTIESSRASIRTADISISYDETDQEGFEYRLNGGSWVNIGNPSSFNIFGLSPDTAYTLDVRAYNSTGGGSIASTSFNTLVDYPQGTITFDSVTENTNSVDFTISYSDTDQTGFEYSLDGGSWVDLGNVTSFSVSGLNDNTDYEFEIRAYNTTGAGSIASTTFTTVIVAPEGTVTINSVEEASSAAVVRISYSNSDQDGFEYRLDGGSWVDAGNNLKFTVSGLTESTTYNLDVRAYNVTGESSVASTSFTTTANEPEGIITIDSVTPGKTDADVTFTYSDTDQDGFEYSIEDGSWVDIGDTTSFTISNLQSFTKYTLKIRAYNTSGYSVEVSTTFTTIKTVSQSDRYKLSSPAFGSVDRASVKFNQSFELLESIKETYGFKTIYHSELPFVYVEQKYRKFKYFEKEITLSGSVVNALESDLDSEIITFVGEKRSEFYNVGNVDSSNIVLSIKEVNIDETRGKQYISMKVDYYDITKA